MALQASAARRVSSAELRSTATVQRGAQSSMRISGSGRPLKDIAFKAEM